MGMYETDHLKEQCSINGLEWNQQLFDFADKYFKGAGLNQAQVDEMVMCHMNIMVHVFDPKAYSFVTRLKLAFHFLFGKRPGHDTELRSEI